VRNDDGTMTITNTSTNVKVTYSSENGFPIKGQFSEVIYDDNDDNDDILNTTYEFKFLSSGMFMPTSKVINKSSFSRLS